MLKRDRFQCWISTYWVRWSSYVHKRKKRESLQLSWRWSRCERMLWSSTELGIRWITWIWWCSHNILCKDDHATYWWTEPRCLYVGWRCQRVHQRWWLRHSVQESRWRCHRLTWFNWWQWFSSTWRWVLSCMGYGREYWRNSSVCMSNNWFRQEWYCFRRWPCM